MSRNRNKIIFDVLANSSQYKAQMAGVQKTSQQTSKAIIAAFAISSIAIGGTLKAFAEYETLLIKVGKTADLQGKELRDFGKEITAMSARIPLSTKELLDLAASAAQIGVKGKANILKFTETVAKLGTATNIVGSEGVEAIARLLNVTGEGIDTIGRFGAVITALGNSTAATESEILSVASRVGKATAQFDLGTVSVLGISAALKGVGVQAELAGSAIGRTFFKIQDAVFDGGEALDTFSRISGRTGEELKQIFEKDATAAFQIFIESLNKLPANEVIKAMEAMGLKGVRLREVIGTLAKRSDLLTASLKLAADEAKTQTALNEEFTRAVDSLANSWVFLKTEIFNAAKSMGSDLAPAAKELIRDVTELIKDVREFNEVTGGTITTSIVMAAKISALVIVANKLRAVLIATGIVSGGFATQMGIASTATKAFSINTSLGATKNGIFAGSFLKLGTSIKTAGVALKAFQVTLGVFIAGLIVAIELGKKLGEIIGDLADTGESEKELIKTRETLNTLLGIRVKLEEKVAAGDKKAEERLERLNQEIKQHEGLISVLEREVEKRKQLSAPKEEEAAAAEAEAVEAGTDSAFIDSEIAKTEILSREIEARIAAANREAELLAAIGQGISDEAIKNAEDRNKALADIESKKIELDRVNNDLSRTGIDENEKAILELKRGAIEKELVLLEEKFSQTQEKTAEQEAQDMESRLLAKQELNLTLTEQELLFLEEKKERDVENREIDLELKSIQDEEDLLFLQSKLLTEQGAKDAVRQEELNKIAKAHNDKLTNEAKFGKTIGGMQTFFNSEQVKGVQGTLSLIGNIKTKEGSKAAKAQQAIALVEAGIQTAQATLGAFTAMVGIPIVGPILAPIAAAAALTFGLQQMDAIRSQSFAVGTDFVPRDMTANIHQGEGIIPARENQFLQSGDLVLGSPDVLNQNQGPVNDSEAGSSVILNFEGANFFGNVGDNDEFINQIEEAIAIAIDEGRFAGFQQSIVAVT